ncbi:MAG: cytochrome c maturation protein CcmE [Pirellulales bacterium]
MRLAVAMVGPDGYGDPAVKKLNVRLIAGAALLAGATTYLAYLGSASNWRYYVHVEECCQRVEQLAGKRVRVNGLVARESLEVQGDRAQAQFTLTGGEGCLPVLCRGQVPSDLRENTEVIVEGVLSRDGVLHGDKILTDFPRDVRFAERPTRVPDQPSKDATRR